MSRATHLQERIASIVGHPVAAASAADADAETAAHFARVRAERWASMCPTLFAEATIDSVPEISEGLHRWCDDVARGRYHNGLLLGPVGTGKTWAAWAALRDLHMRGVSVRGVSVMTLLDACRPDGPGMGPWTTAEVLLLDDLGAERRTDWTADVVANLIDTRHTRQLPTLVTSNLTAEALHAWVGERAWSRLSGGARAWWLDGPDRRRTT